MKNQFFPFCKAFGFFGRWIGLLGPYFCVSAFDTGLTADYLTDTIYSFDLKNGSVTPLITIPGGIDFVDLQTSSPNTLYALGYNNRSIYAIDLIHRSHQLITPVPIGDSMEFVYSIDLANANTAYAVGFKENKIYRIELENGHSTTALTLAGDPGLTNIAIKNDRTAYVIGYKDNNLYEIDLIQDTYRLVTPVPVGFPGNPSLEGLSLVGDTAYVVGNMDGNLYSIDLSTGNFSLITPNPINARLINLAIDQGIGYTVNNLGGEIFAVNLSDGTVNVFANILGTNLTGMALWSSLFLNDQIPVNGLKNNDLHLANYLNENASQEVIDLFLDLTNTELLSALQGSAPTRNAFLTYATQMGSVALSRLIHDHERQKRFQHPICKNQGKAHGVQATELLSLAGENLPSARRCKSENFTTVWMAPFGGYTQIQAQQQTPAFNMKSGGVLVAWDRNGAHQNLLGMGGVYLYTKLDENDQAGYGHIDQGFLTFYGTLNSGHLYLDMGFSGGVYRGESVRRISFPGVLEMAKSHPQGWQLAPSFEIGYNKIKLDRSSSSWFNIAPFFLVDWVANWEKKNLEGGAGELNMGQKPRFCSLIHGEAGLRFHEISHWNWGQIVFREKLGYSYQKAFGTGSLEAFLISSPSTFTVSTLSKAQNLIVAELSLLIASDLPSAPYVDFWYEGEYGSGFQLHQVAMEIGKNF